MRRSWNNFWFKWHRTPCNEIVFGSSSCDYKKFRTQRLINILLIATACLILYKVL